MSLSVICAVSPTNQFFRPRRGLVGSTSGPGVKRVSVQFSGEAIDIGMAHTVHEPDELYEYAISGGAGTLLDYGVTDRAGLNEKPLAAVEATGHMRVIHMEAAPCAEDCETGK